MSWSSPPPFQIDPSQGYQASLKTSEGTVVVDLFSDRAPVTVNNFVFLAQEGFYDGVVFHRVIEGFMVQGGDPEGTGRGGPGYRFEDELDLAKDRGYPRGTLAMANAGPDTNGSQFFIVHQDAPLPPDYSVFGEVVEGMEVVDAIATTDTDSDDRPLHDITIQAVEVTPSA